ncbi:MAG: class I SAM-dependent methyltransferase, partial [Flammeovirgaceae bacterium]|nr:class I SAM-dependent methyltransferase [Flammeovirgaceae bacterium]MDW8288539.1 methyltransferase domain-containing protein [Flammeovirgaceae bacterium]
MKWWLKAIVQKILSNIPFGEDINYWLQRNITHTYPISSAELTWKCHDAIQYKYLYETYAHRPFSSATILEIGGGRDLCMPLVFYLLGAKRIVVTDLYRQLKLDLLQDVFRRLQQQQYSWVRAFPFSNIQTISSLKELGIEYLAPIDITREFFTEKFQLVYSFSTLEHIGHEHLLPLLQRLHFLLHEDGLMIHTINLEDHYTYTDKTLSPYHFLRYASSTYRWINSSLHFQNRLRLSDYLSIFEQAKFKLCWMDSK